MFCMKCGKPLEGDRTICDACAAQQAANQQPVQPQQPAEPVAPVWQDVQQPIYQSAPAQESFSLNMPETQPEEPARKRATKKKKKRSPVGWIVAAALVVCLAVGTFFSWPYISSFFNRTFQSPDEYLQTVEQKAQDEGSLVDILGSFYGKLMSSPKINTTSANESYFSITLSKDLTDSLEALLSQQGVTAELSWLKEVKIAMDTNITEKGMSTDMKFLLNGTQAIDGRVVMDYETQTMYMGFPSLNKTFFSMDMSAMGGMDYEEAAAMMEQLETILQELSKCMPSEEEFENILYKYINVALSVLDDVEKENETVELGGLKQSFTKLTTKISQKDLLNMAIAVLEEAEDDEDLKDIVDGILEGISEISATTGGGTMTEMDTDMLFAAIPMLIEQLKDVETDDDFTLIIDTYVDMKDEIQGRTFRVKGAPAKISYLTVTSGNKFAFEADFSEVADFVIEGSGTDKKDIVTGKYDLVVGGETMFTMELENFNTNTLTEAALEGTIRLIPAKELVEQIAGSIFGGDMGTLVSNADVALELVLGENDIKINVLVGKTTMVGLGIGSTPKESTALQIPQDAIAFDDPNGLNTWTAGLDFEQILSSLKKAGVPDDYLLALESLLESGLGSQPVQPLAA